MIPTSARYKQAVVQGTRSSDAKILFGVYDVTSKDDATPSANTSKPFTPIIAIKGDIRQPDYNAGTFEPDHLKLDGTFYLMPDDVNPAQDILGWWSGEMSDSNREFGGGGNGLVFNQSFVQAPFAIPPTQFPITVEANVFISSNHPTTHQGIVSLSNLDNTSRMSFVARRNFAGFKVAYWDSINFWKEGSSSIPYDTWIRLSFVIRPSQSVSIYVDGILDSVAPLGVRPSGTSLLYVGKTSDTEYFRGMLSDIRVWNVALTDELILVNAHTVLTGLESGLIKYLKLNEGQGTVAIDSGPRKVDGVITNATWGKISIIPTITLEFSTTHSSRGIGVFFGSEDYCTDFDITWYRDDTVLGFEYVVDNIGQEANVTKPIDDYNKIVIRLLKTAKPYRYARLMEIGFGLEASFDGNELVSASITEEVDPSSSVLSINTLKFTAINTDQKFNMLNPEGIFAYLQRRQKITASSGLMMEDGTYEFVPLGTYYLSNWTNSNGLTASLEATDSIGLLDKTTYRASKFWVNEPVENVLRHILNDAGQFSMVISLSAGLERVNGYIPPKSHREAIADVLISSSNVLQVERSGIISVDKVSYADISTTIDYDTMLGSPTISQKQLITSVEVREFGYTLSPNVTELSKATFSVIGIQRVVLEYGKAATSVAVNISGSGVIVGTPEFSAVSAFLDIQGTGSVTVVLTGKEYIESVRTVSADMDVPSGELPQIATVADNKLISGTGSAVANNLLAYYQRRIKQSFSYSDNPAIQAGDYVSVETMFGQPYNGIVEHQEIAFSPNLKGSLEVTG